VLPNRLTLVHELNIQIDLTVGTLVDRGRAVKRPRKEEEAARAHSVWGEIRMVNYGEVHIDLWFGGGGGWRWWRTRMKAR